MKITVRRTITIEWDGSPEDYIRLADTLSREYTGSGLDSLDCGDATGIISDLPIDWDEIIRNEKGDRLIRSFEDDSFEYDLPREETNILLTEKDL